jgi:hypothetical protein
MSNRSIARPSRLAVRPLLLAAVLSAAAAVAARAQTYTAVDLTPDDSAASANGISGGIAAGFFAQPGAPAHAAIWTGTAEIDLHPAWVDDVANRVAGRSTVEGISGGMQAGWAVGPGTGNHLAPVLWRGNAAGAVALPIPFVNAGGQALATDGGQAVGYGIAMNRDGTTFGSFHAVVWNAATGAATDLGDGGNGAKALGVGGGRQVGYVSRSGALEAALWSGSAKSLVSLHPGGAVMSEALGTDGPRQVGFAGYDVRVRVEAVKGAKTARFDYAMLWTGSAVGAVNLHPVPVNTGVGFTHSHATAVAGGMIVGYGSDASKSGTPAYNHAVVWDASFQAVDLNAFLPAGFVGSVATSVDRAGNVAGVMLSADGRRHAVVWVRDPALN